MAAFVQDFSSGLGDGGEADEEGLEMAETDEEMAKEIRILEILQKKGRVKEAVIQRIMGMMERRDGWAAGNVGEQDTAFIAELTGGINFIRFKLQAEF
jgi:hypothetical protein